MSDRITYKRLRWLFLFWSCMVCCLLIKKSSIQASPLDKELNIYAMYLENEEKGDAVLLESKGEYLLMDMGVASKASSIIRQLEALHVTEISVYFSHLHKDHIGGGASGILEGLEQLEAAGIKICKLYLPDPSLASMSVGYPKKYVQYREFMYGKGQLVYLKLNDTIRVGDATGKIIGPLNVWQLYPDMYINKGSDETEVESTKYTYYENNLSLAAIFTCGNTRFFTAGDCLSDEAGFLLERYGSDLACDIMKFNHHGTGSGNSKALIDAIQPRYSFGLNSGLDDIKPDTKKWQFHMASHYASSHGICYFTGNEKKTLIYQIRNDVIKLYQGETIQEGEHLKGWQQWYGADGEYRDKDVYYLDQDGQVMKGLQWISGRLYNFGDSGCMIYANYDEEGSYLSWKKDTTGCRYYKLDENKELIYLLTGFQKIKKKTYYFNQQGYRLEGVENPTEFTQIGWNDYLVGKRGVIKTEQFIELNGNTYYVDEEGAVQKNKKLCVGNFYYLFREDGSLITADCEMVEYDDNVYLVYPDGHVRADAKVKIDGDFYYFDDEGIMRTKELVKVKGNYYFFDTKGRMVVDKIVPVKGKPRYFDKEGVMYRRCYIEYDEMLYECDDLGVMKYIQNEDEYTFKYDKDETYIIY